MYGGGAVSEDASSSGPPSAFRLKEKRYQLHKVQRLKHSKGRLRGGKVVATPTDFSDVLCLSSCSLPTTTNTITNTITACAGIHQHRLQPPGPAACSSGGSCSSHAPPLLVPPAGMQPRTAITFARHPGLVYFPAALDPALQLHLMQCALLQWPQPPARTNHTQRHGPLPDLWLAAQAGWRLAATTPPAAVTSAQPCAQPQQQQQQPAAAGESPACRWHPDGPGPAASALLQKLRWASLGPLYNWGTRTYEAHQPHTPLPAALQQAALRFARLAEQLLLQQQQQQQQRHASHDHPAAPAGVPEHGHGRDGGGGGGECAAWARCCYRPDAALVNYYREGDTLGGHQDDVERDVTQPIVSISLGCPAVFLMGGPTRDVDPTALLLCSGDVLVLDGTARRCFHGVPRILPELGLPAEVAAAAAASPECSAGRGGDASAAAGEGSQLQPQPGAALLLQGGGGGAAAAAAAAAALVDYMSRARVNISIRATG